MFALLNLIIEHIDAHPLSDIGFFWQTLSCLFAFMRACMRTRRYVFLHVFLYAFLRNYLLPCILRLLLKRGSNCLNRILYLHHIPFRKSFCEIIPLGHVAPPQVSNNREMHYLLVHGQYQVHHRLELRLTLCRRGYRAHVQSSFHHYWYLGSGSAIGRTGQLHYLTLPWKDSWFHVPVWGEHQSV